MYLKDPSDLDAARQALEAAEAPDGSPLFAAVQPAHEVWHGPYVDQAPDLLITPHHGVEPGGTIGGEIVRPAEKGKGWIAHHHPSGVLLAWGENVRAGTLDGAQLADVMPTLLAMAGAPIPADLDGQILDVFTSKPDPGTREPLPLEVDAQAFSEEESRLVEERLRGLGYLE